MIRIDPETASQVHFILARCRTRGTDPVAALDAAGLINHPAAREARREIELRQLIQLLHHMTPTQLGGGMIPATAADMKRCILEAIERVIG